MMNPAAVGQMIKHVKAAEKDREEELDRQISELEAKLHIQPDETISKIQASPASRSSKARGSQSRATSRASRQGTSGNMARGHQKVKPRKTEPSPPSTDVKGIGNKKPFIRKPHLTDRPLAHNPQLEALLQSLPQDKQQNHKGGTPPKHISKKETRRN